MFRKIIRPYIIPKGTVVKLFSFKGESVGRAVVQSYSKENEKIRKAFGDRYYVTGEGFGADWQECWLRIVRVPKNSMRRMKPVPWRSR